MTRSRESEEAAPAPAAPGTPSRRRLSDRAWAGPLTVAVLSVAAAAQALRLWSWRPGTPLSLDGDAPSLLVQAGEVLRSGGYGLNPSLGAPFGLNLAWFPNGNVGNFALIRAIGLITHDPATVTAIFFVLQFPLAALSAYWVSSRLGSSRPFAVVVGVLFSVLPGHQEQFSHLYLSAYWMVPLALLLVTRVARGERLVPGMGQLRNSGPLGRGARRRATATVGIVVAVGLADVYYVAFTLLLLAAVLVVRLGTGTRPRHLLQGGAAALAIGGLCGISMFVATRGRAGEVVTGALPAQRVIGESETYAGKLIELVLPWYEHRAAPLRFLSWAYGVAAAPPSVERPALGILAVVGVVGLLWFVISRLATGRRIGGPMALLAALVLLCLAFYTRAGLGSLVALFVTPQIRTWSRFVVFIGFIGLAAAGYWLTTHHRLRRRRIVWPAAAMLLTLGVLDQTNPEVAPDYTALRAERTALASYSRDLQREVGDCPVFQLPVVAYPEETPPGTMGDYDHFLPSVFGPDGLSWSYGAIRGTARYDWQLALPIDRPGALLQDVADAGFCAVSVDRDGYAGSSDPTSAIRNRLGAPVATDETQNLAAFTLADVTADRARRDSVLRPVVASIDGSLVDTSEAKPFQWTGPGARVTVANLGDRAEQAFVSFTVEGNGEQDRTVRIRAAGHPERIVTVSAQRSESITMTITVAPGTSTIDVTATGEAEPVPGSSGRQLAALKLLDLRVDAGGTVNSASLQEFAAASPRSLR